MRISNREKIMIYIFGIILIGFGYYNFIYTTQMNEIEKKTNEKNEIEQKYNITMNTIKSMDDRKSDAKILRARINDKSHPFYPTISEEHIIIELDKLLKDSGLGGGINFNPIAADSVESVNEKNNPLPESSIQGIVDEYNNVMGGNSRGTDENVKSVKKDNVSLENSKKDQNKGSNVDGDTTSNVDNTNSNNSGKDNSNDKKKNTVHYVKVEINFEGSYEGLNKFLNEVGKNERKIVVSSIKISEDSKEAIKGAINIEIYSIPKIDNELDEYLNWSFNNVYGKNVPFSKDSVSGSIENNKDLNDFKAIIKSINSDLPTVMIGKADDSLMNTYVYADSNTQENAEIILTQDGDKYYYKYKTSKGNFPANYNDLGTEFVPRSDNIVVAVSSEARATSNDDSGINLKIVNNTNKLAVINISSDDVDNPRVKISGDGSNISVNQK